MRFWCLSELVLLLELLFAEVEFKFELSTGFGWFEPGFELERRWAVTIDVVVEFEFVPAAADTELGAWACPASVMKLVDAIF